MRYRVRVLRRAQADLVELADYLSHDVPEAAQGIVERLLAALEGLSSPPRRGSRPRDERLRRLGFRFVVVGRHLVFFKIAGREVRIYRVLRRSAHTRRFCRAPSPAA